MPAREGAEMSREYYEYMLERGMPEHIAQAFMDSFASESGLDPTINEREPLVEGSRGGRGLYQLTGSRRTDFENKYGTDYNWQDQIDNLFAELEGPEARAADAIYGTNNREGAVRAITWKFLRPAVDNSDHRIGAWSGQQGLPPRIAADGSINRTPGILPEERGGEERPPSFMQDEYADNWLGRVQNKRDTMRAGLGDKLGIDAKQMEGIGGGLQGLGQYMMRGGFG